MKQINNSHTSVLGFTLVELAIVLVIAALILGGTLGGYRIYERAKLSAVMDQLGEIVQGVEQFQRLYGGAMPGDMFDASDRIPGVNFNGNGNGTIDGPVIDAGPPATHEAPLLFNHLTQAGILRRSHNGTWGIDEVWKGPHAGSHFFFCGNLNIICYGTYTDLNLDGELNDWTEMNRSVVSPQEAHSLDLKYDDGLPLTGTIIASPGFEFGFAGTECVDSGAYRSNTNKECRLTFVPFG